MPDFYDVLRRRRMVRAFTDEAVDPAIVDRIVDAARRAPTAGHSQGVELVVVTDASTRAALAEPSTAVFRSSGHENFVAQAPVHVVICTSPEIYKARYRERDKMRVVERVDEGTLWSVPYWYTDAGCTKMLLLLAAVAEGISAAFVGVLPGQRRSIHALLSMPDEYVPIGIALLGHEAPNARDYGDISAAPRPRRPIDEVVHRERW